jgi:SAM-dependent methyltransferase
MLSSIKHEEVREYYGKILNSKKDLKTDACCTIDSFPEEQKQILSEIHPEILEKFYGCGSPIPPLLDGKVVLDLGCGTGRDVYIAAKMAGPDGHVIGVDMTEEQLAVAARHAEGQAERFGFDRPNVSFRHAYIEDLISAGIESDSVDVVISNCVVNLSPDKHKVLSEVFRVLKPGGELLFSDVFAGRRVPKSLREDPVVYGECLGGALYIEDFRRTLASIGIRDYRVVAKSPISLDDEEIRAKVGMIDFYSMTIRVFKLDRLEDICEDYGQTARYLGTIPHHPHRFDLDDHHQFVAGKPMLVCGNTAAMLTDTRYAAHFDVTGDRKDHYGPFECTPAADKASAGEAYSGGACC